MESGSAETKGDSNEGVDSCIDLHQLGRGLLTGMSSHDLPQDYATIFCSTASMLPGFAAQLHIHGAANAVVDEAPCIDPCIDNDACAGLEVVRTPGFEGIAEQVQERRRRNLCRWIELTRASIGGHRVDGHAGVVDETHVCGGLRREAPAAKEESVFLLFDSRLLLGTGVKGAVSVDG